MAWGNAGMLQGHLSCRTVGGPGSVADLVGESRDPFHRSAANVNTLLEINFKSPLALTEISTSQIGPFHFP